MHLQESSQDTKPELITLPNVSFIHVEYYGESCYILPTRVDKDLLHEFFETIQYNRKVYGNENPPILLEVAAYVKQFAGYALDNYSSQRGLYGWFMVCGHKTLDKMRELDYIPNADYWILRE
jgi:hypothetical protein